jgi:hypothetical protein
MVVKTTFPIFRHKAASFLMLVRTILKSRADGMGRMTRKTHWKLLGIRPVEVRENSRPVLSNFFKKFVPRQGRRRREPEQVDN